MNKIEGDILKELILEPYANQRILAEAIGHSLGTVNRSLKGLIEDGYLDYANRITEKSRRAIKENAPQNAIILAAGFGMRMVPINTEIPKGLLRVHGEILIERIIKQLQTIGIKKIYIVVGFLKEQYEYLIEKFGVELIVNPEYAAKNNLYSLWKVLEQLSNSYIVPCDIWCRKNPFSSNELYSWYMVSDSITDESDVCVNRKMELVRISERAYGNKMIGIAYLLEEQAKYVRNKVVQLIQNTEYDNAFWESALYNKGKMIAVAKIVPAVDVSEINTYEQLRDLDSNSNHLQSDVITYIKKALQVSAEEIVGITVLKKGMTNRSFLFSCDEKKYIMRVPGEGTDNLISREQEAAVYRVLLGKKICDNIVCINPQNGYKITEYLEGARVCDPLNNEDVKKCIDKLRNFHRMQIKVDHEFDIFGQLEFYEQLWKGAASVYTDYTETKEHVLELKEYIHTYAKQKVLCHIDAVPDNFLFFTDADGKEEIRLIDWEYAGMQDPHIDIAMFSIYALYNKQQIDNLIDIYFEGKCDRKIRIKIYCYVAVCGLLWSNWCEYKSCFGVEFGEYSSRQYRYAKDYYHIVKNELNKKDTDSDI